MTKGIECTYIRIVGEEVKLFKSIGIPEILLFLIPVAILALLIWGIISIISKSRRQNASTTQPDSIEIARQRYAKGEITKEQFEQMKKDLS